MTGPKDVRGHIMCVGDFVCYTVNREGSTLQFGTIHKITEKTSHHYDLNGDKVYSVGYKIIVDKTDVFRAPEYDWEWDSIEQKRVSTDRQLRSGSIDHYPSKFMLIN